VVLIVYKMCYRMGMDQPTTNICGFNGCRRRTTGGPCWQHGNIKRRPLPVIHSRAPHVCPAAHLRQCPECGAVLLPNGNKAVVVTSSGGEAGGIARLCCRNCMHRWKVPRVVES